MKVYYIAQIHKYADPIRAHVWSAACEEFATTIRVPNNTPDARAFRLMADSSHIAGQVPRERFATRCVADTREGAIALLVESCARDVANAESVLRAACERASAAKALLDI